MHLQKEAKKKIYKTQLGKKYHIDYSQHCAVFSVFPQLDGQMTQIFPLLSLSTTFTTKVGPLSFPLERQFPFKKTPTHFIVPD